MNANYLPGRGASWAMRTAWKHDRGLVWSAIFWVASIAMAAVFAFSCGRAPDIVPETDGNGVPVADSDFGLVGEVTSAATDIKHPFLWVYDRSPDKSKRPAPINNAIRQPDVSLVPYTNATPPVWACVQVAAVRAGDEGPASTMAAVQSNQGSVGVVWTFSDTADSFRVYAGHCKVK